MKYTDKLKTLWASLCRLCDRVFPLLYGDAGMVVVWYQPSCEHNDLEILDRYIVQKIAEGYRVHLIELPPDKKPSLE